MKNKSYFFPVVRVLVAMLIWLGFSRAVEAQFTYSTNNDGTLTITGDPGASGAVTIPTRINGLLVTAIGTEAFFTNTTMTSLIVPTNVVSIGQSAFEQCTALENISLSTNLQTIVDHAFLYCESLQSVVIPASVTTIDEFTFGQCYSLTNAVIDNSDVVNSEFEGCTNLISVTLGSGVKTLESFAFAQTGLTNVMIPANVTNIAEGVFMANKHLTAINVAPENTCYSSIGGVLFDKSQMTLIGYPNGLTGDYVVPGTVTNIENRAFEFSSITTVELPGNLATIGDYGFFDSPLTSVIIPASVNYIGFEAFERCYSLTNVCFQGNTPTTPSYLGGTMLVGLFTDDPVTIIYYVAGTTGWGTSFQAIPTAVCTQCGPGAVQVTISPAGAVSAGAEWQVDGGAWQTNLATISLSGGGHTISFNAVYGWTKPPDQLITITNGFLTTATGLYTAMANVGAVQVNLAPSGAVSAGAQWQIDSGAYQSSGTVVTNLAVGSHTLSFNTIPNWISPGNQMVTVAFGTTNSASATYLSSGAVQVNLAPAGAVTAGAQWALDGGPFQSSGAILSSLTLGNHTVSFNSVSGWIAPSNQTVTIAFAATNVVAAAYSPAVGALQVNIGPAGAVSAGAQWRVDGGAYQSSGAVLTNLPVGSHTVSFNTVGGWITPGNISASVALNATNTYSASYTIAPGAVQVTILPAGAAGAGAWQLDGGTAHASGALVTNVSTGSHTISFVPITGWLTATNQSVSVSPGTTATATGYYTPLDGLQVSITPTCAVSDGAQWQVDGGAWYNSGDTVTNLNPGLHTVAFNTISGWATPASQPVTIAAGHTATATGNYHEGSVPGTITWINAGANQKWSNPTNWDLNRVPTNTDVVLIPHITGTNCVLDVNATVAGLHIGDCADGGSDGLNFDGQTLIVTGPIIVQPTAILVLDNYGALITTNATLSGTLNWVQGTLGGTLTINNDGVMQLANTAISHSMPNCILTNNGTVTWIGGQVHGGGTSPGTVIYNNGLWNAQDVLGFYSDGGNGIVFNNAGTFRKSQGTTATTFYSGTSLNSSGNVDVQTGVVSLQSAGNFSGGTATNSGGLVQLNGGTYNVNGLVSTVNFQMLSGSLTGANVLQGGFTWSGGDGYSASSITVKPNTSLVLNGTLPMVNCLFTNNGTVNWVNGQIQGGGSAPGTVIYNNGLWDAQCDSGGFSLGGNGLVINNTGMFRKSAGTGQTSFYSSTTFSNPGTINVQAGSLNLQGNYSLNQGILDFGFNNNTNHGLITLGNNVVIGGALGVNVGGTFAPTNGSKFQIISSPATSGAFSSASLPAGLTVTYDSSGVYLLVVGAVPVQLLAPHLAGTNFLFQFPTASGQSYTVQRNDDLTTTNWVFYTNAMGSGVPFQFATPVSTAAGRRFFRITEP